jgi:hypothetical protein
VTRDVVADWLERGERDDPPEPEIRELLAAFDALQAEVGVLRAALQETAQGVDADGAACWCCIPSMIPYRGHDTGCETARAALGVERGAG